MHSLLQNLVLEKVWIQNSFCNPLFLVPRPNNKWHLILDLITLNQFLRVKSFKIKTPESIWLSLQQGEWVTLLDFSNSYFHCRLLITGPKIKELPQVPLFRSDLPIQTVSIWPVNSYYGVHICGQGGQVDVPMEQWYKDPPVCERLVDKRSPRILVTGTPRPYWQLKPRQAFNFVGYQYDLPHGVVRPTLDRWQNLQTKICHILERLQCFVRQFMSHRSSDSHRKTSALGCSSHETNAMASKEQLAYVRRHKSG